MTLNDKIAQENIQPKHLQHGNQKLKCPSCQPPHNSNDTPLSFTINDEGAVWNCHHCEFRGGYKENLDYIPTKKQYVKPVVPSTTQTPSAMLTYFAERGITKETVVKKNIYLENRWIALPYKDADGTVVNIKYRTRDKKFKQSANAKRILYNYDLAKDAETIIFVEGEFDCLALIECGYDNVVSLPDGAPKEAKFKEHDARFKSLENCPLENAKKVIIFTDNDQAGKSLHDELLHRFGKDMCWYVDYPNECKDANDVLIKYGAQKVKDIIENATPYPVDGLYAANDYYGGVMDLYNGNYVKPIDVGFSNLDDIYKVLKGTFHCVTGIPNHGKSSFVDQMLIKIAENHDWKFAVYSPEHSTKMHLRRLVQMQQKKAFDEGFTNRMTTQELQESLDWINDRFYFIETKDVVPDIDYILSIAKASCLKYGVNGLVIDPFNEVSAARSGNTREDEHIRDFISKCKRFARIHDITIWVVAHPTKLPKGNDGGYAPPTAYDISGAAHWHNQSDAVLTVHRDFDDDSIQVLTRKIREQGLYGKIGQADFLYDAKSRCFVEKGKDEWDIPEQWQNR